MATKTMTLQIPADEMARYEAAIKQICTQMDRLRKQMRRDQADIEKSKKRTRAMLAELQSIRK